MVVGRNRAVLAVAVLVTACLVGPACGGENVKDCTVDNTCEVEPKNTSTLTTTTTMEPKKTLTTSEPKKTTTITNPKKTAMTITTAKTPSKTTAVAPGDVLRRYNVSGNDSSDRSAPLKEIVVLDVPVTPAGDTNVNGAGNATTSVGPAEVVIKSDAKAAAAAAAGTASQINSTNTLAVANSNVTVTNATINTTTITTTESTRVVLPPNVVKNGAQVAVRFVANKYCYCDLIRGGCDMNCCCDTDCTSHDLKTFTSCSDQVENNLIKPVSILFDSSLFYVVVENVPSDYFYPEREPIQSESKIEASLRKRELFTWYDEKNERPSTTLLARMDTTFNSYDLTYRSVRWMYTTVSDVNSTGIKTFSLKNGAFNSLCSVDQPVEYLVPTNTSCQTFVRDLKDSCNNDSSLSYKHYFGENGLFKVLQPVYSSVHKTEKYVLVTVRATAHHRCVSADNCDGGPLGVPVYSSSAGGGVCRGAVVSVEYRVEHNGTRGARALEVHFGHADVTDVRRPVYVGHRFGVRFVTRPGGGAAEPRDTYRRSGKPGYETGGPVLLVTSPPRDGSSIPEGRRRPEPMTLPEPDGQGLCQAAAGRRRPVNFLENVEVRCRVPVVRPRIARAEESTNAAAAAAATADFCHDLQNRTLAALGDFEGTLVASLGDPDVAQWIPTVVVKPQSPPPSGDQHQQHHACPSVIDGVHVRVLYSHAGAYERPRATVLGVSVNYTARSVAAADGPLQYVAVRASAVFVDLTRPPVRTFAEPPTYEFRLPEDFYYPFWSSDTGIGTIAAAAVAAAARFPDVPITLLSAAVVCAWHSSASSCR